MKVRRPYAFCCIEGGGRIDGCTCDRPDHGFATVDVKTMLPGDEPELAASDGAIAALIAWARSQQAFPDDTLGGAGRGHIDENHRFKLRDMVHAIDVLSPCDVGGVFDLDGIKKLWRTGVETGRILERYDTSATLDNTAVEEATAVIRAHAARTGVPAITIAAAKTEKAE